jgi:hypothetical protein
MTTPLALPCFVLAGVNCAVGIFYLLLFLRRREPREHLPFSMLCFGLAAYDCFCAGLYGSRSLAEGIFWQRLQLLSLSPVSIFNIWFLGLVAVRRLNKVLWVFILVFAALVPLALTLDQPGITLSLSTPAIKPIYWGPRLLVTYYESRTGAIDTLGMATSWIAYVYLFHALFRAYRRERSRYLVAIMLGQLAFAVGLVNDGLVASRVYSFVYVSEYSYLVVVTTMAYALLNKFVDLQVDVERLNSNLESRVQEALADIKVLRGLIPICAWCRKIRDDQGYWSQIEDYVARHSDATFSHGICPDCSRNLSRQRPGS